MRAALHSSAIGVVGVEEACWPSWARDWLPEQRAVEGYLGITDGSSAVDSLILCNPVVCRLSVPGLAPPSAAKLKPGPRLKRPAPE